MEEGRGVIRWSVRVIKRGEEGSTRRSGLVIRVKEDGEE